MPHTYNFVSHNKLLFAQINYAQNERTIKMKFKNLFLALISILLSLVFLALPVLAKEKTSSEFRDTELYVGGMPFGAKISSEGLTVVKFSETKGKNASCAYLAGMREGDIIIKINDRSIRKIEDFVKEIDKSGGNELKITVIRGDKALDFSVTPVYSKDDGKYKTGIWVKDSTSGIGTVTYINPSDNTFGGLGHGICDSNGKVVPFMTGVVLDVEINGVVKGQVGSAGELKGCFAKNKIGQLTKNTPCGVFGKLNNGVCNSPERLMKICPRDEVVEGEAYIWCTLSNNKPEKYEIQISDIDKNNTTVKSFKVKVTDQELLEKTGGIVQGMSGSPIVQNGKLVGAVTHVFVNDPAKGYGISIDKLVE